MKFKEYIEITGALTVDESKALDVILEKSAFEGIKKGALHAQLGYKEGEKIPKGELQKIQSQLSGKKDASAADKKLLKRVTWALNFGYK